MNNGKRAISVLYIHHSGVFGGASRSLLEMIKAFPEGSIKSHLITQKGNVVGFFERAGVSVIVTNGISQFDNTAWGYYRGYRWLLLAREFYHSVFTFLAILKAKREWKHIDLVHINEITNLPSVIMSRRVFRKPVIVHSRSVQQGERAHLRFRTIKNILRRNADFVIAIDDTVKKSFSLDVPIEIIHNGYTPQLWKKRDGAKDGILENLKLSDGSTRIAFVGNLLAMKGIYEFIEAAKICIVEKKLNAHFLIVGDNVRNISGFKGYVLEKLGFARDVRRDVETFILSHNLDERVHLLGFTPNIQEVYENIDILCFPSHLNAVGRPVIEAAFSRVPSIVAMKNRDSDMIIDGETGLCIEPRNVEALVGAIEYFCSRPSEIKRMGECAHQLALDSFNTKKNALKVLEIYKAFIV